MCIGGWENTQLAGKARMPYKMNAQSFARMRNQQSVHKRAKDARWRSHKVVMQGCIKTATQSRCTMQRHKWLSLYRCNGTNGCQCTDATTLTADDLYGGFAPQPRLFSTVCLTHKINYSIIRGKMQVKFSGENHGFLWQNVKFKRLIFEDKTIL